MTEDWTRKTLFWEKSFFEGTLWGSTGEFFDKNKKSQKQLKRIWVDSVFDADSESDISFDIDPSFPDKKMLTTSQNRISSAMWLKIFLVAIFFRL